MDVDMKRAFMQKNKQTQKHIYVTMTQDNGPGTKMTLFMSNLTVSDQMWHLTVGFTKLNW